MCGKVWTKDSGSHGVWEGRGWGFALSQHECSNSNGVGLDDEFGFRCVVLCEFGQFKRKSWILSYSGIELAYVS